MHPLIAVSPLTTSPITLSSRCSTMSLKVIPLAAARPTFGPIVKVVLSGRSFVLSQHTNHMYVFLLTLYLSYAGLTLERRSNIGKSLSAPIITMFMSLVLSNAFVLPFESTVYSNVINGVLVPLAIPLLLFDGDLKKIARDAGPVLRAFFVGAISTVAATVLSFRFIPMADLGSDGWKVAAALASRHIGGAVNFVAVANTLGVKASTVSSAIAADNVVVALYFVFLFSTSRGPRFEGKGAGVLDKVRMD